MKSGLGIKLLVPAGIAGVATLAIAGGLALAPKGTMTKLASAGQALMERMALAVTEQGALTGPPGPKVPISLPELPNGVSGTDAGYLPAATSVTPSGGARVEIPLAVPAGRAGMQPSLSLEYNGGGNGLLGVGWGLTGMSVVAPCGKTIASDGVADGVDHDGTDNFCLDGQKLVYIGETTENGASAKEYRTEDDTFAKIVAVTGGTEPGDGPSQFIVYTAGGLIRTYNALSAPRSAANASGFQSVGSVKVAWRLSLDKDRAGNTVLYTYHTDFVDGALEYRPAVISYTSGNGKSAARQLKFNYETRQDVDFRWSNGVKSTLTKRLTSIEMHAPNPATTELVWRYNFAYEAELSPGSRRSRLASVQQCGAQGGCLWAKQFTWNDNTVSFTTEQVGTQEMNLDYLAGDDDWEPQVMRQARRPLIKVMDFDGDGLDDIVYKQGSDTGYAAVGTRRGTKDADGTVHPLHSHDTSTGLPATDLSHSLPIDLNADGAAELWTRYLVDANTHCYKPYRYEAGGFVEAAPCQPSTNPFGDPTFADFNGDGLADKAVAENGDFQILLHPGVDDAFTEWTALSVTGLSVGGEARYVDVEGDGRTEVVRREAVLGLDDLGQPTLTTDGPGVILPNQEDNKGGEFADPNGDGLQDYVFFDYMEHDEVEDNSYIRWNTGNGFAPPQPFTPPFVMDYSAVQLEHDLGHAIADVNGDGRDDIVQFTALESMDVAIDKCIDAWNPNLDCSQKVKTSIYLSRGDGTFGQTSSFPSHTNIKSHSIVFESHITYDDTVIPAMGDFNGDGRLDFVSLGGGVHDGSGPPPAQNKVFVHTQTAVPADLLAAVWDEKTLWPREEFEYSWKWSDRPMDPEPAACQYPLSCVRKGFDVVRKLISRAHWVNPADVDSTTEARVIEYAYDDPVSDALGNGFLGFGVFREWDRQRPQLTTRYYDHRQHATIPQVFGERRIYPFAGVPKTVVTAVPILTQGEVDLQPATALARVSSTSTTYEVKWLNNNKTQVVLPRSSVTKEWEQDVAIDWDALESDSPSHIFTPLSAGTLGVLAPTAQTLKRERHSSNTQANGDLAYDAFGNLLRTTQSTVGGVSTTSVATYKNESGPWLIGLLLTQATTTQEAAPAIPAVTRNIEHDYTALGQLHHTYVEKNHPDPNVRSTTEYTYDNYGLVVMESVSALVDGAVKTRRVAREYEPWFQAQGQPDERVHISEVWLPDSAPAYPQASFVVMHPALGVPLVVMDANGVQASTGYDDLARPIYSATAGQLPTTITYAARHDQAGGDNGMIVTSSTGAQTATVTTDALGRTLTGRIKGFDGTLTETVQAYDRLGRVSAVSRPYVPGPNADIAYATSIYDALDRVLETRRPDGVAAHTTYSFFETHSFDADGREAVAKVDVDGRLIRSINKLDGADVTTTYTYEGLIQRIHDPDGHEVEREHDLLGRVIRETSPDTGVTEALYNGLDELVQTKHKATGKTVTQHYDDLGRLIEKVSADGTTQFVWDTQAHGIGKLARAVAPGPDTLLQTGDDVITKPVYDAQGRTVETWLTIDGVTYKTGVDFDPNDGRLLQTRFPSIDGSGNPGLTVQYGYNATDYLNTMGFVTPGSPYTLLSEVNARNPDMSLAQGTFGNGMVSTPKYKPLTGQLEQLLTTQGGTEVMNLVYEYDDSGLIKRKTDQVDPANKRIERFTYDGLARLHQWRLTMAGVDENSEVDKSWLQYGYSADGNLLTVSKSTDGGGSFSTIEQNTYSATQPHALITQTLTPLQSKSFVYDAQGRQKSGDGRTIVFTEADNPKTLTKNGQTWTFTYDANGTRVKRAGPTETIYVGGYERRTTGGTVKHVFHTGVADIIREGPAGAPVVDYKLADALGSVSAVVHPNGQIDRLYYEPFGQRKNLDGSAFSGNVGNMKQGFTDHEMDDEYGLINMRGRMYDPGIRRFLSADPIVSPGNGQSWNSYSYVWNNPVNLTDPSGFAPMSMQDAWLSRQGTGHADGASTQQWLGSSELIGDATYATTWQYSTGVVMVPKAKGSDGTTGSSSLTNPSGIVLPEKQYLAALGGLIGEMEVPLKASKGLRPVALDTIYMILAGSLDSPVIEWTYHFDFEGGAIGEGTFRAAMERGDIAFDPEMYLLDGSLFDNLMLHMLANPLNDGFPTVPIGAAVPSLRGPMRPSPNNRKAYATGPVVNNSPGGVRAPTGTGARKEYGSGPVVNNSPIRVAELENKIEMLRGKVNRQPPFNQAPAEEIETSILMLKSGVLPAPYVQGLINNIRINAENLGMPVSEVSLPGNRGIVYDGTFYGFRDGDAVILRSQDDVGTIR